MTLARLAALREYAQRTLDDPTVVGQRRTDLEYSVARLTARLGTTPRCRRCGRTLTDPDSIARGVGPECTRKDQS